MLVVDDGSSTAQRTWSATPKVPPWLHPPAGALGQAGPRTAYIVGFKWGLGEGYEYLFEMDADFSHNLKDPERLREAHGGRRCGRRLSVHPRRSVSNWPWHRIAMSYGASLYVNTVLGLGVKDPTAGFKCYRAETLRTIRLDHIHFVGYAFQIEMKYNARKLGFPIAEVPITFIDRELGTSKMSLNIFREAFLGVLQMRRFDIQPASKA